MQRSTSDEVLEFLSRAVPWPDPEGPGYVNLHWLRPGTRTPNKMFWHGKVCRSPRELFDSSQWALTIPTIRDQFFCLSLQRQVKIKNGKIGPERSQKNAISLRSLWIDLDVVSSNKAGKGYPSTNDAIDSLKQFIDATGLPAPSALVASGSGGVHVYWIGTKDLQPDEWQPLAEGLKQAILDFGLNADAGCTTDSARVLRVPMTRNHKKDPPTDTKILLLRDKAHDYDLKAEFQHLVGAASARTISEGSNAEAKSYFDPARFPQLAPIANDPLSAGIERYENNELPLEAKPLMKECAFLRNALLDGGKDYGQPLWNLTTLCATFIEKGEELAHSFGNKHPGYSKDSTDELYARKMRERNEKGLGWPSCKAIRDNGCTACGSCPHFAKGKSPLHLIGPALPEKEIVSGPTVDAPSFVDPFAEFAGPPFPMQVLPPTLRSFVEVVHKNMGADKAAIAMSALAVAAGAIHKKTQIKAGEGWFENCVVWAGLVGDPSSMKTPIIKKATKPLWDIDAEQHRAWERAAQASRQQTKPKGKQALLPPRPARYLINDVTAEKVAEILAREPRGSLMVHDELAGFIGNFERYGGGAAERAFYLQAFNGGQYLKDRVGRGRKDLDAEIRVDNLALGILGGVQPDRLAALGDLTSDGLLQRMIPVLMTPAMRGDEYHHIASEEGDYAALIKALAVLPEQDLVFSDEALAVRDRVVDHLHKLETFGGLSKSLTGAVGKLRGYFARFCLLLHLIEQHDPRGGGIGANDCFDPEIFTAEAAARIREVWNLTVDDVLGNSLSAGIRSRSRVSPTTAEAAERLTIDFILPHVFAFYDVVAGGGREREMVRNIGNFILASDLERLRPSDITSGVRSLRGESEQKIKDWAGRFCAMGWLTPEEGRPGTPPKAWHVAPGLRHYFAEQRQRAKEARALAHDILKAGGTKKAAVVI